MQDEVNKLRDDMDELQTDFNEFVKEQDMIKIIQIEQENKISKLILTVSTLEADNQEYRNNIPHRLETLERTKVDQTEYLKTKCIIDQQQEAIDHLQRQLTQQTIPNEEKTTLNNNSDYIESHQKEINNFQKFYSTKMEMIEKIINDNKNVLHQQVMACREDLSRLIYNEINKIKGETATLKVKVTNLEETINGFKLPHIKKENTLPYVEKYPPVDLFEIDWRKYPQENQSNIHH
jgi:chromosome segregation ATPase